MSVETTIEREQSLVDIATARGNLYGLLATIFGREMSAETLRQIREPELRDALAAVGVRLERVVAEDDDEILLRNLALEYARLFVVPGDRIPPYGSVHLGGPGASLWERSTVEVRNFIERCGFDFQEGYAGLPDAIDVELEFMQRMAAREAATLACGNQTQADLLRESQRVFLSEHLLRWVDGFCDQVVTKAEHGFYREMASLLKNFVATEREEIGASRLSQPLSE